MPAFFAHISTIRLPFEIDTDAANLILHELVKQLDCSREQVIVLCRLN